MISFTNNCDGVHDDSLDVRFTKACDNDCAFCCERGGMKAKPMNVEALIQSTISSRKSTALVLGGEPLLFPEELLAYVSGIRPFLKEIYVTTSLPKEAFTEENYPLFCQIMEVINGLNVSLQHYKWKKNNEILKASSNHNRFDLLKEKILPKWAGKVRVSINLVKGGIDKKWKLEKFLKKCQRIGVRHVKINELQGCPKLYVSYEDICKKKFPSPYAHGCQTEIKMKCAKKLRITLKRCCFMAERSQKATKADLKKLRYKKKTGLYETVQVVAYEDGMLSNGWITEN